LVDHDPEAGGFRFTLAAQGDPITALVPRTLDDSPPGAIVEICPSGLSLAAELGRRAASGGAALVIDYGYDRPGTGDTLQAVRRHGFVDPLTDPGGADLTAHVDFRAVAEAGRQSGAASWGPVGQGAFLLALGIAERAAALK